MADIARCLSPLVRGAIAAAALACLVHEPARAQNVWDDPAFALYRQGLDAMDAKDFARAATLAREATASYPEHLLAWYLLGQALLAQSRWEDAAQALSTVTGYYPGSFSAHRDLGGAYQQMGKVDDAMKAWEAALAIRSDDDVRLRMAVMLVNANQQARAEPYLAALAEGKTKSPEVYLALARIAYDKNDFAGAAVAFEKAVALKESGRTWFNLGVVRARLGNTTGALEALEKAGQFPETKEQAAREAERVKAAAAARPARSSRPGLPK